MLIARLFSCKKRLKEIECEIPKITPKMLSKGLRALELNGIVKRTVHNTIPVSIEYEFTESGRTIKEGVGTAIRPVSLIITFKR